MSYVLVNDLHLTNIADAIREKSGSAAGYKPREMAAAIAAIPSSSGGTDATVQSLVEKTLSGSVVIDCSKVGINSLAYMNDMTSLSCNASIIDQGGVSSCPKLTSINLPYATSLGKGALGSNPLLTTISIPNVRHIGNYAFSNCNSLEVLDLGSCLQSLMGSIVSDCTKLNAIIIRTNTVPSCSEQWDPFTNKFKASYSTSSNPGYIYVPRDMISEYQNFEADVYGSNPSYDYWTDKNYRAIEDYPEICG